ncbi:hypothetical protein M0812_17724 [Anaeramoeba flamelloides]|uniref:Protein kinase domain-containing protein n=1 Tax=Anaeramoeba flamelloides TaxID=1746091 RepID=A0AAV7Z917_9EUKA|nr:hypothetical protein M0812_17724 [Anaeramoeba flamelloides]
MMSSIEDELNSSFTLISETLTSKEDKVQLFLQKAHKNSSSVLDLSNQEMTHLPSSVGKLVQIEQINICENNLISLPQSIGRLLNCKALFLANNKIEQIPPEIGNLKGLLLLNLGENNISKLPDEICGLPSLNFLACNRNQLCDLPENIGLLTELGELYLDENEIESLPESIGKLTKLSKLDLNANNLIDLPSQFGDLRNLVELDLSFNSLETLPPEIGMLTLLKELILTDNKIEYLPFEIEEMESLQELNLRNNVLSNLPDSICNLRNLNCLIVDNNHLTHLPKSIGKLTKLVTLYANNNQLRIIPKSIGGLINLLYLKLNDNELIKLTKKAGNLINLKEFNIYNNKLKKLPLTIGNLINLTKFYCGVNKLSFLPKEIGKLKNLRKLYIGWNLISELPEEIENLINLQELGLSSNKLNYLPNSISKLTNLKCFYINDNPMQSIPNQILERGSDEVLQFIRNNKYFKNLFIIFPNPQIVNGSTNNNTHNKKKSDKKNQMNRKNNFNRLQSIETSNNHNHNRNSSHNHNHNINNKSMDDLQIANLRSHNSTGSKKSSFSTPNIVNDYAISLPIQTSIGKMKLRQKDQMYSLKGDSIKFQEAEKTSTFKNSSIKSFYLDTVLQSNNTFVNSFNYNTNNTASQGGNTNIGMNDLSDSKSLNKINNFEKIDNNFNNQISLKDLPILSQLIMKLTEEKDRLEMEIHEEKKIHEELEKKVEHNKNETIAIENEVRELNNELKTITKEYKQFCLTWQILEDSYNEIDPSEIEDIEQIGSGSYGNVWKSWWRGKIVAVKRIKPEFTQGTFLEEFKREAILFSKARHPNIVLFMGACTQKNNVFLVTEFMAGGSLFEKLRDENFDSSLKNKLKIVKDIACGMNYLHLNKPKMIIHRDLKSLNVLFDSAGNCKICDFGMARLKDDSVMLESFKGSPCWMAPEMLKRCKYTEKVDIYSFGIVLWEVYTQKSPYRGFKNALSLILAVAYENHRPYCKQIEENWKKLMNDCWQSNPKLRPNFSEIIHSIDNF